MTWFDRLRQWLYPPTPLTLGDVVWCQDYAFVRGLDGKNHPTNGNLLGVVVWIAPNGDVGVRKQSDALRALADEKNPQALKLTPMENDFAIEPVSVPWEVAKDGQFMVYPRRFVAFAEGRQSASEELRCCRKITLEAIEKNRNNDPRKIAAQMDADGM